MSDGGHPREAAPSGLGACRDEFRLSVHRRWADNARLVHRRCENLRTHAPDSFILFRLAADAHAAPLVRSHYSAFSTQQCLRRSRPRSVRHLTCVLIMPPHAVVCAQTIPAHTYSRTCNCSSARTTARDGPRHLGRTRRGRCGASTPLCPRASPGSGLVPARDGPRVRGRR